MDYDQGLNPIGKCYMTGIGFNPDFPIKLHMTKLLTYNEAS
jgi:hypothetical protein